jgi:choline dehydrogenase-like flavoprotein
MPQQQFAPKPMGPYDYAVVRGGSSGAALARLSEHSALKVLLLELTGTQHGVIMTHPCALHTLGRIVVISHARCCVKKSLEQAHSE